MTSPTFETFRPINATVARHVDYYYLDYKPENEATIFECFPHYNTSISLYIGHRTPSMGQVIFDPSAAPLQIFTPIRERVMRVSQIGPVHRVVVVFKVLGVQHFWRNASFTRFQTNHSFFSAEEIRKLFATGDTAQLTYLLDGYLSKRYAPRPVDLATRSLAYILDHREILSVSKMAAVLGSSRRHLHRVFKAATGVSIKKFHEIIVLRGVINRRLFDASNDNLTQLAYGANFSDQAHMIRVFRKLTGNPPRQFFAKGRLVGKTDTFWHLL